MSNFRMLNDILTFLSSFFTCRFPTKNMPKPRQQQSDLRTTPLSLEASKIVNLQGLREQARTHWNLRNLQPYFPAMELLFKLDHVRLPLQYGLKTKQPIQTIASAERVFAGNTDVPIHRKTTMLLSPYQWIRGDFGFSGLPVSGEVADQIHAKLQSPHTAAYVGALASTVLSESGCLHFPTVYGTYVAIANEYVLNISDDYEDLCERPWFLQNLGHTFDLRLKSKLQSSETRAPLHVEEGETIELETTPLEPVEGVEVPTGQPNAWVEETELPSEEEGGDEEDGTSTDYVFDIASCSSSGSDVGADGEDEEPFAHAVFKDVQVQTTVMEKCEGTLFDLIKSETSTEKRMAWVAQIVLALAFAQRNFGFVHNDLHVYNIMWVPTPNEYLYYNHAGTCYRVPTYGKLLKIIDFDRATFSLRLPGMRESRFFMSDQFDTQEEAGGQYNTEPFYNSKYSEVKPNPSFDLVRLATCLFWDCFPEGPFHEEYASDPLYQMLLAWLTLPDGTSILFRDLSKKDAHDRYHGFHLYKAIARYCKDTAVPRKQLDRFANFKIDRIPNNEKHLFIEP